jgi:hypothetical protein
MGVYIENYIHHGYVPYTPQYEIVSVPCNRCQRTGYLDYPVCLMRCKVCHGEGCKLMKIEV